MMEFFKEKLESLFLFFFVSLFLPLQVFVVIIFAETHYTICITSA